MIEFLTPNTVANHMIIFIQLAGLINQPGTKAVDGVTMALFTIVRNINV